MGEMIRNHFVTMVQDTTASLITWTPRLLGGVILLVVALVVAKVVARVLRTMLTKLKLGAAMQRLGVDDVLKKIGIAQPLVTLLPRVVYYLLLVLVARTLADSLGLEPVSDGIAAFFAYLPNVFSAVIILVFGSIVAQLAGSMVSRAARESGIDFAASLGSLVSALIHFRAGHHGGGAVEDRHGDHSAGHHLRAVGYCAGVWSVVRSRHARHYAELARWVLRPEDLQHR